MRGPSEPHHHPDKPCNICGNVGSKDALVTCSKCHLACEHLYCMRLITRIIPQFWVCEECLSRNGKVSPRSIQGDQFLNSHDINNAAAPSKVCVDSQGLIQHKKLKPYETGKVRFLPVAEAIRLSSGTQEKESHERYNSRTTLPLRKVIPNSSFGMKETSSSKLPVTEVRLSSGAQRKKTHENKNFRMAMPSKNVIPKLPNPRVEGSTSFKLPSHGGARIVRKYDQQTAKTSEKSKVKRTEEADYTILDVISQNQLLPTNNKSREVKLSESKIKEIKRKNANADYATNATSYESSTQMCSIHISTGQSLQAVAGKNSSFEERDLLLNILPKLELYCLYRPSIEVTWNGKLLFSNSAMLGEFYGDFQFQAHPPCKIHCKAFDLLQNLPNDLRVKPLPRRPLWEDLFEDGSPDFDDIALYFFPADNTERSKHNFSCLFEHLETKNLVMRSYIDGVELLISTSKQLHVDSQKIIARSNTQCFLWGIFRRVKLKPNQNLHQVVDMDIDMEGGRSIGRVDVVVSKELAGRPCGSPEKGNNPGSSTHQLRCSKGKMANAKNKGSCK